MATEKKVFISSSQWFRYAFAVLAALVGFGARVALSPILGSRDLPFLFAFPAVAAAAWFGGLGPSLLCGAVDLLLFARWFNHPSFHPDYPEFTSLAMFAIGVCIIGMLGERSRRSLIRARSELTARKEREISLEESNQRLRTVLEGASVALWEWSPGQPNVTYWNEPPMLNGLTGSIEVEWWNNLIHPDDRAKFWEATTRCATTGDPFTIEYRLIRPEGSVHWVHSTGFATCNAQGQVERMAGVIIDVTSQKLAEGASGALAAIVESSDDAIISKDLNGIIKSWNAAATRMFGYTAEEIIGSPISRVIPRELSAEEGRILQSMRRGERLEHFETVRMRKSGEHFYVSITVSPIRDDKGNIVGISKIVRDISERKRVEHALRKTEMEAAKGRLAAAIAHEINNPLEAITNIGYLISRAPEISGATQQLIETLNSEVARVGDITRRALAYYRDSGEVAPISVTEVVESVLDLFQRKLQQRSIKVVVMRQEDIPRVIVRAGELRQVVSNLVSNSLDAMQDGGTIIVRTRSTRDQVRITVSDNGSGIPKERRALIFRSFETTKGLNGTGLGLWVSKGLIEKYGGKILFRSSTRPQHRGTSFTVVLPRMVIEHAAA